MTTGTFILSLDCEGLWGQADVLTERTRQELSPARLARAYSQIVEILEEQEIPATFAFVELFTKSADQLAELDHELVSARLPYCSAAMSDLRSGRFEGWIGSDLVASVPHHHEIASHGVTHTPWTTLSRSDVEFELSLTTGERGRTFVFPRNQESHHDVLAEYGFIGYRAGQQSSRAGRLAREFAIFQKSQKIDRNQDPVRIPSGEFLSWRRGARRIVPPPISASRLRHLLRHAAATGGVVHLWTHPENFAQEPSTLTVLDRALKEVRKFIESGQIIALPQSKYCAGLGSAGS